MATDINKSRRITVSSLWLLACLLTTTHVFDARTHAFQQSYTTMRSRSTIDQTRPPLSRVPTYLPQKIGRVQNSLVQYAIIYGEGGDYQSEEEFEASSLASTAGDPDVKQLVADQIYTEFPPSFLTNIACAQAPPPHNHLMPQDVLSAELISADLHQAQIAVSTLASAGGAGDGRCVQLLIPIQFEPLQSSPPPSQPSLMAEYIVQEFQRLEQVSLDRIAKKEWEEDNADQLAAQEKIIFELQDEASLMDELLPDWWTFCELNKGLEEESDTLKNLLNEDDFVTDLNVLFQSNYHKSPIQVIKTCVTAIGPSGVYLRSYSERQEESDEKYFIAELSIPFPEKAPSRDELRSNILTMIETAGEQLVVPAEQALVGEEEAAAEEVPLEEIPTTITVTKLVVDNSYAFQEQLLQARIQVDKLAIQRRRAQKEEAFHRSLLEARLSIQANESGTRPEPKPMKSSLLQSTEAELADKYANIEDVGERAFAILKDLGMI